MICYSKGPQIFSFFWIQKVDKCLLNVRFNKTKSSYQLKIVSGKTLTLIIENVSILREIVFRWKISKHRFSSFAVVYYC